MKSTESKKTFTEELKGTASEIINQIRQLIKEGNARRLVIQSKEGKILFQTQLTAGVAGTALVTAMAPIISAIGMFAMFMNDVKIIVERYPEEDMDKDEYEVDEAEVVIDVEDETDEEEEETQNSDETEETEKTVGKKKSDEEDDNE